MTVYGGTLATSGYVPAEQAVHTLEVMAAATELYAPMVHAVHPDVPEVNELYDPAAHDVHLLATAMVLYAPAPQVVHTEATLAAVTSLYKPTPHVAHAEVPVASVLYDPAAH